MEIYEFAEVKIVAVVVVVVVVAVANNESHFIAFANE